jgi:hypothetical protein
VSLAPDTEAVDRTPAHNFGRDTVADYPANDDRERQTEQTIAGLPPFKSFSLTGWTRARGSG